MSVAPGSVVVVGGGVIGAACAHYLNRAGWRVTIVDQGRFGAGCSHGNCGFICPSHVLPLAEPGMLGKSIRALFARNSPFAIRPRFDPALWAGCCASPGAAMKPRCCRTPAPSRRWRTRRARCTTT